MDPKKSAGLIILADWYPNLPDNLNILQSKLMEFVEAQLPVFCEFLPVNEVLTGESDSPIFNRLISCDIKSPLLNGFEPLTLFEAHQLTFLKPTKELTEIDEAIYQELLTIGRVAGVYNATYGIPKENYPGVGHWKSVIFASTKISDFDPMEYRLKVRWAQLLFNILSYLCKEMDPEIAKKIASTPNPFDSSDFMNPALNLTPETRKSLYYSTFQKGLDWYQHSGVLNGELGVNGIYEGYESSFDYTGKKELRTDGTFGHLCQRADCTADSAFCNTLSKILTTETGAPQAFTQSKGKYQKTGENLWTELFTRWQYYDDDHSICRGFFGWYNNYENRYTFYSDDNGRCALQTLFHGVIQKDRDILNRGVAAIIALAQTTGKNGHRRTRIDLKDFYKRKGRKWFRKHKTLRVEYKSPHYDGWTFAAILYGAYILGDNPMQELIQKGIDGYMKKFPKIPLEHSVGDDFSKLLVAAVFLYQCTKKEVHLDYVHQILNFFKGIQDPISGAFPERDPLNRHARTEKGNSKYGKGESAIYTQETDSLTDQLYSAGFLAWAFYLAHKTGKCPQAEVMLLRLLDYLCAIQLKSQNPQLNGAWTRGFDYKFGEPYGANGDVGWGAYSLESGWTIGPILSALGMYLADFDPFAPLSADLSQQIRAGFREEFVQQLDLELDWKLRTPKAHKSPSSLTPEEIALIKSDPWNWKELNS